MTDGRPSKTMNVYQLVRHSGLTPDKPLGVVGYVVVWPDGTCILKWATEPLSEERYPDLDALKKIRLSSGNCSLWER